MRARVAAIVLAAGRSTRMGDANKLTLDWRGQPLVARVVDALASTSVDRVCVVTGHQADEVSGALAGREVELVPNPDHATGMASSIAAGIRAVADAEAALICLGDMPEVSASTIERLVAAWDGPGTIAVPVHGARRGHPVLFGRDHFPALEALVGDRGARSLLDQGSVLEVPVDDPGIHHDVDTPEDLATPL